MQSSDAPAADGPRGGPRDGAVRIGTRGSLLARTQSGWVQRRIAAALGAPDEAEEIAPLVLITTTGDRIQDRRLLEVGGKALFTKEIEQALLDGRVDCAVHSGKDVPADMPDGLALAAFPEREDPRDALLTRDGAALDALPRGARVGTASLRRQAQLLSRRPDLEIVMLRGNVDTRLARLDAGEMDAVVLALAGLKRLGLADRPLHALDPEDAPPAPAQGALAIQTRTADAGAAFAHALDHAPTRLAVAAERGAMEALEGSCRTAVGAWARLDGERLRLSVEALAPDGSARWRRDGAAPANEADARALGRELGEAVRTDAGDRLEWTTHA
ncbi:MAG: hydroxymethylbilane synthase [Caulobacteraceae bacterium]|nr:hydroxymethylbilane synthase [Caulobacter sp.]